MINTTNSRKFYINDDDVRLIENYNEAIADDEAWVIHHRLETHFSDGTPRPPTAQITPAELKALGMYYHRPPEELIFMTKTAHISLHHRGTHLTEETRIRLRESWKHDGHSTEEFRKKQSEAHKGKRKGMKLSEEHKRKIGEANKGKRKGMKLSEEQRKKLSESLKGRQSRFKGRHWKLVDGHRVWFD